MNIDRIISFFTSMRDEKKSDKPIGIAGDLATTPLLAGLNRRELKLISDIIHVRSYSAGEFIFKKSQPGAAMFIIKKGRVIIQDISPGADGKKPVDLATLEPGSFFGELALLDDSPRSAYARATTSVELYAIFRADIGKILKSTPVISSKIYFNLARIIGGRLKRMNEYKYVNYDG